MNPYKTMESVGESSPEMINWLKKKAREAELMDEYRAKYGILWEAKYPEIAEKLREEFKED